jgi:phenylalanyl-tRNA synthetase alpha chain
LNVKNLKWMINGLLRHIFGPNTKTRFRLSNFPFTEPSFEVDASCPFCGGNGCHRCKQSGWIELLGCGIVHEKVLNVSNITDKIGLAAGFGVERIAMIKYGIEDVRDIYNNDFRFSTQFRKESK